jgi:hypothetical protein
VSTDRSPWADLGLTYEPDIPEPTAELVKQDNEERTERLRTEYQERNLWEKYAGRLTAAGTLIR